MGNLLGIPSLILVFHLSYGQHRKHRGQDCSLCILSSQYSRTWLFVVWQHQGSYLLLFLCHRGTEEIIHIRLHRVNQASFFFQLGAFVIKALLLVHEPLLFALQRFQARQFSVALYGEKSAPCRLIDDKLCFVFGTVCRFVRRLHIGIIQDHYQLCLYRGNGRSPPKIQRCRLKEKNPAGTGRLDCC